MAMKNKYAKRARISEAKIREIVRYVTYSNRGGVSRSDGRRKSSRTPGSRSVGLLE